EPRPVAGRQTIAPGPGQLAKRRPIALHSARRQEAPDPAHVRTSGPESSGPEARAHGLDRAGRPASGQMALSEGRRALSVRLAPWALCGRGALLAVLLQAEVGAIILLELVAQPRHGARQFGVQSPGWIDHKHAAAVQAESVACGLAHG